MKPVNKIVNNDIKQLKNISVSDMSNLVGKFYLGQLVFAIKLWLCLAVVGAAGYALAWVLEKINSLLEYFC